MPHVSLCDDTLCCWYSKIYNHSYHKIERGDILELLHVRQHEAGVHGHHHLVLDLTDILWQGVHRGSNLPGHGHAILGIRQAVLLKILCINFNAFLITGPLMLSPCLTMLKSITPGFITSIRLMIGRAVLFF